MMDANDDEMNTVNMKYADDDHDEHRPRAVLG